MAASTSSKMATSPAKDFQSDVGKAQRPKCPAESGLQISKSKSALIVRDRDTTIGSEKEEALAEMTDASPDATSPSYSRNEPVEGNIHYYCVYLTEALANTALAYSPCHSVRDENYRTCRVTKRRR